MTRQIDLKTIADKLGPIFAEAAEVRGEAADFVADNYDLLEDHKIFSAMVPTELGGGGASHREMCEFVRELGKSCGSTALALSMHQHLVAAAVFNDRNGKPGRKLLQRVVDGESVLVTSAPYEDPAEGWQVLHFPVPFAAEGISTAGDWDTLGMRATGSETVILDKVFVPDEAVVLRRPREGYHPAFNVILTVAMPLIVSAYLGVAEAAAEIATVRARQRAGDPATAIQLGELGNLLTTARLARDSMVEIANDWQFSPVVETAEAILTRKTIAAQAILATAEKALETGGGGGGFYRRAGLERRLRDVHGVQFHPLPEKRQQQFCGRLALGLNPIGEDVQPRFKQAAE